MSAMLGCKRALSPSHSLVDDLNTKRARQDECAGDDGMDMDTEEFEGAETRRPLFGDVSRDGNQWLDPSDFAHDGSPCDTDDQTMEDTISAPLEASSSSEVFAQHAYMAGGHYGAHPLSSLPLSHPLRAQLSVDTFASIDTFTSESTASIESAGPPTPADDTFDAFDEDTEQPCYAFAKDSRGISVPFSRIGHA